MSVRIKELRAASGHLDRAIEKLRDLERKMQGVKEERFMRIPLIPIPDEQAPRSGEPWTAFEKDILGSHLDDLVHTLALRLGRSTKGILWALERQIAIRK